MLEHVLDKCYKLKHIVLTSVHPAYNILRSTFGSLSSITIRDRGYNDSAELRAEMNLIPVESPLLFLQKSNEDDPLIHLKMDSNETLFDTLDVILKFCAHYKRTPMMHLTAWEHSSYQVQTLAQILKKWKQAVSVRLLAIDLRDGGGKGLVTMHLFDVQRQSFPLLSSLILNSCKLCLDDLRRLAEASTAGRLPMLRNLDISWNADVYRREPALSALLRCGFPKLKSLIARDCYLTPRDLNCLDAANVAGKLPCLTTLDLSHNPLIYGHISNLLAHCFLNLNVLILRFCALCEDDLGSIQQANAAGKLPQLKHLDISQNPISSGCRGVSALLSHRFKLLAYLILCKGRLNCCDLDSLAQAKLDGKLPALRYIDVSRNGLTGHLSHLTQDPRTGREVSWDKIVCFEEQE